MSHFTPDLTPEFWVHVFQFIFLSVITWFVKGALWAIKKGNEELRDLVKTISDGPAKMRADEVRVETKLQFQKLEKRLDEQDEKMDQHEVKDQRRHDEVMDLIKKTATA